MVHALSALALARSLPAPDRDWKGSIADLTQRILFSCRTTTAQNRTKPKIFGRGQMRRADALYSRARMRGPAFDATDAATGVPASAILARLLRCSGSWRI